MSFTAEADIRMESLKDGQDPPYHPNVLTSVSVIWCQSLAQATTCQGWITTPLKNSDVTIRERDKLLRACKYNKYTNA
jgi:hypothetical protein